ncbi:MAG: hypothetical protein IJV26_01360 [Lachnospiraceae bacterium]|nr:hypothetical protein [Lachnospiraceae bacterium]
MAMNPMEMMKLGERLRIFTQQHQKVPAFLKDVADNGIREGTIIEMKVTTPEGKEFITNIKVTAEDLETVEILKDLKQ